MLALQQKKSAISKATTGGEVTLADNLTREEIATPGFSLIEVNTMSFGVEVTVILQACHQLFHNHTCQE